MGVGTICWAIDGKDRDAALDHAEQFILPGLPRIEVMTKPGRFPEIVMNGPPALNDGSVSLRATLQSLGVDTSDYTAALEKMWMPASGTEARKV